MKRVYKVTVHDFHTEWRNEDGQLHREGGPAIEHHTSPEDSEYYLNGRLVAKQEALAIGRIPTEESVLLDLEDAIHNKTFKLKRCKKGNVSGNLSDIEIDFGTGTYFDRENKKLLIYYENPLVDLDSDEPGHGPDITFEVTVRKAKE